MNKEQIINFIYYLEDKDDPVYAKEIRRSVKNFIDKFKSK